MYSRETSGAWEAYQMLLNEKTNNDGKGCPLLSLSAILICRGVGCILGQAHTVSSCVTMVRCIDRIAIRYVNSGLSSGAYSQGSVLRIAQ